MQSFLQPPHARLNPNMYFEAIHLTMRKPEYSVIAQSLIIVIPYNVKAKANFFLIVTVLCTIYNWLKISQDMIIESASFLWAQNLFCIIIVQLFELHAISQKIVYDEWKRCLPYAEEWLKIILRCFFSLEPNVPQKSLATTHPSFL